MRTFHSDVDVDTVEYIIEAATLAMEDASQDATPDEVISAVLTLLDRTLRAKRKLQPPFERIPTATNVRRVLGDMLTDHGSLPS